MSGMKIMQSFFAGLFILLFDFLVQSLVWFLFRVYGTVAIARRNRTSITSVLGYISILLPILYLLLFLLIGELLISCIFISTAIQTRGFITAIGISFYFTWISILFS